MNCLVIDIGNTNMVCGIYEDKVLREIKRYVTPISHKSWEIPTELMGDYDQIAICSVVPDLNPMIQKCLVKHLGIQPSWLTSIEKYGIKNLYENPSEVGPDRLANTLAVVKENHYPAIILDFGTAITIDLVNHEPSYLGGFILSGIGTSANALFEKAAMLPEVEINEIPFQIGTNPLNSIKLGVYWGYMSMIPAFVQKIQKELFQYEPVNKIVTGGHASMFGSHLDTSYLLDPYLTLKGLKYSLDE